MFRGRCGHPVRGILPLPGDTRQPQPTARLTVDWTRCRGHGLCARLVPELIQLDEHGYPELLAAPVPFWLGHDARQAVEMCPALALSLTEAPPAAPAPPPGLPASPAQRDLSRRPAPVLARPAASKRARRRADLAMTSEWIAALGGRGPADGG
jgi:ferredoxin